MLRHRPKYTYRGLTVVLENPSRADKINLLSAKGGQLFSNCLGADMNTLQCDVRVREDKSELLEGTKCILLLGEKAAVDWLPELKDSPFGAIRGYIYKYKNIPTICSYFPQDAADRKNHEDELNTQYSSIDDAQETKFKIEGDENKSRKGVTAWSNYKFWLRKDVERAKQLIKSGIPIRPFEPNYHIYPPSLLACKILRETKNQFFYVDIETDPTHNILCFSFSFADFSTGKKIADIYAIPILSYDYSHAYSNCGYVLSSVAIAFRDNCAVAHNGAAYDFFQFANKLKIAVGKRCYDTMIAHHRCYPEVEKSLGHCMSIWCPSESYHKDENGGWQTYTSPQGMTRMLEYNAKDVYGMMLLHLAIEEYAKKKPGLKESIDQANASIRPFLISSLQGIKYDQSLLETQVKENDRLMIQYVRMLEILIGKDKLKEIRGKGKSAMPNSNTQCCKYFHEMMHYPVLRKSEKTGKPSLGKELMFKLKLKYPEQAVIDIIIAYREVLKETGTLSFTPWRKDKETTVEQTTT